MNYPQADNPLILRYRGQPPALKNSKVPIYGKDRKLKRLIPNSDITEFIALNDSVKRQVERQGFAKMAFPTPVMAYAEIYIRILEAHNIPNADGDNAYTMLQETWQDPLIISDFGAMLGAIDNDRQVLSFTCDVLPIKSELEGAIVYLWQMDWEQSLFAQRLKFGAWYHLNQIKNKALENDATINFDDVADMLDNL